MKYKLVCIDMDGTLLNQTGEITNDNKIALKKAQEKGVIIALTTGRIYQSASGFNAQIGIKGPVISSNGTHICIPGEDAPLYQKALSYEEIMTFYECAKKYQIEVHFSTTKGILCDVYVEATADYHSKINEGLPEKSRFEVVYVEDFEDAFKTYEGHILKAFCMDLEDSDNLLKLRQELEALDLYEIASSGEGNIEIMPKGINKGESVKRLAEHLGIPREAIICIGDNENDIPMIEYAGMGIAMGNSVKELLERADDITATNDESGVAKAIDKYILMS